LNGFHQGAAMTLRPFETLAALILHAGGTDDPQSASSSPVKLKLTVYGQWFLCVLLGISTLYFYQQDQHEAKAAHLAMQARSNLRSQVQTLSKENQNLVSQAEDRNKVLEQTQAALALALRSTVSTTLPTPKLEPSLSAAGNDRH
jgi:hypothetical protein